MIEFDQFGVIKPKIYLLNCLTRNDNLRPIIMITHNRYSFLANDRVCKASTEKKIAFL